MLIEQGVLRVKIVDLCYNSRRNTEKVSAPALILRFESHVRIASFFFLVINFLPRGADLVAKKKKKIHAFFIFTTDKEVAGFKSPSLRLLLAKCNRSGPRNCFIIAHSIFTGDEKWVFR